MEETNSPFDSPYDAIAGFRWWEGKRWIFNLAVGLVGLSGLLFAPLGWPIEEIFVQVVFYGIFLNVCYCAGFFIEILDQVYLKGIFRFAHYRIWLLGLGTAASMLVTFLLSAAVSMLGGNP